MGNSLLHNTSRLDHLREEHLPFAKQAADNIHAIHQGPLDQTKRRIQIQSLVEILDKNGAVLQKKTFTSAKAKCNQKKNLVCRAPFGEAIDPKAASWRVRGVEGSKKGPQSELAYFIVETDTPLWAVVNPDLTLARGAGVVSVSKQDEGQSAVLFDRDVSQCAYTANVGFAGDTGVPDDGAVTVVGLNGEPNGVYIATYDQAGASVDSGFHLVVTCGGSEPPV